MAKDQGKSQRDLIADLNTHEKDPLLTLSAVGRALGRHHDSIKRMIDDGFLRATRVGKLLKVRKSDVAKILNASTFDDQTIHRLQSLTGED
jgi:excisionase family DNA binding protein